MSRVISIMLVYSLGLFLAITDSYACSKVVVKKGDDYVKVLSKRNKKYIIKEDIDLGGSTVKIGEGSTLVFKGGSFANGIVQGRQTKISKARYNTFHDCGIKGTWNLNVAFSSMFDEKLSTIKLLKNLSRLSFNIGLFSNREYYVDVDSQVISVEKIFAAGKEKPLIRFHTTNPNVPGLIIKGDSIIIQNIKIEDDYQTGNDFHYGVNNPTLGNTITILPRNKHVTMLSLEGCEFMGGTSSSYVASSQVEKCCVHDCFFSGYMADHAVYCSMSVDSFIVKDCRLDDVSHATGAFKVRSSKNLKLFSVENVSAHNFNGYLAAVSLLNTPSCALVFRNITVSKDEDKDFIFYGLCLNNESKSKMDSYNASEIKIDNCNFGYGYMGHPLIYSGSSIPVYVKKISYTNTVTVNSHFGGGIGDFLFVRNCSFRKINMKNNISLCFNKVRIDNTDINCFNDDVINSLFLINYDKKRLDSLTLKNVVIDGRMIYLCNIEQGNNIDVAINNCKISKLGRNLFYAPQNCCVNYIEHSSEIQANKAYNMITRKISK